MQESDVMLGNSVGIDIEDWGLGVRCCLCGGLGGAALTQLLRLLPRPDKEISRARDAAPANAQTL